MNNPPVSELSRRHFIAQTGIGLAAVSTLSRAVAQGTAANSRLKLGLIGCGKRGQWIAELFAGHGGYEIAAVADYFDAAVKSAAGKFKLSSAQTFTGLQCHAKMIARGGLDAVAIISPPYFHPEQAQAAVAAGLHVYLAKPIAVDVPGCQSIAATGSTARKKGLVFLVDYQTRTNEFFIEALRRVHSGAIGDLCFGESSYHAGRLATKTPPGTPEAHLQNWVFDQALSGDIIVEQNVHTLDVMSWIMRDSPPVRCTGTGGRRVRVDVGNAWDQSVGNHLPSAADAGQRGLQAAHLHAAPGAAFRRPPDDRQRARGAGERFREAPGWQAAAGVRRGVARPARR
jgi:predicted dehydrogenase